MSPTFQEVKDDRELSRKITRPHWKGINGVLNIRNQIKQTRAEFDTNVREIGLAVVEGEMQEFGDVERARGLQDQIFELQLKLQSTKEETYKSMKAILQQLVPDLSVVPESEINGFLDNLLRDSYERQLASKIAARIMDSSAQ